ncbi:MAG: hypothetical protein CMC79_04575 [Flavobacteriaceae bacterium]|nr:hypothetical protein [Flavobacteriaceae bacterium]|tara:strand:+ start:13336 stop:16863 length:3528 start_codon:yes stop_codon:yes gene_type:complete
MESERFILCKKTFGLGVFLIALITYCLTVEPTASYWDAGEYISTSAKLQIGHPPGAPLYQMLGAFFSLFAASAEKIALMVNLMSVFSSAFTILFLFLTITILFEKIYVFKDPNNYNELFCFFGSAACGSLALCFSDSFWFNAVEAEVYAMATLLLSVLFYLGLKWEKDMGKPRGDRWLLLISFIIGLSFGVHFMGLLTIPALGMLYYFKNYQKITLKGFLIANTLSIAILLFIFKLLLPLTLAFFGNTEVYIVNTFGLPFNSGTILAGLVIISLFYFSLGYTRKKNWVNINTGLLCVLFVLLGFSSWIMIPIRANANTVINENSPSDARLLLAYYNLEQYPETKLFYGPFFSDMYVGQDDDNPYKDDKPKYERNEKTGKYIIVNHWENARINANQKQSGFLPRLWSTEHAANYMNFTKPLNFRISSEYSSNERLVERINEFKSDIEDGLVSGDEYHTFFKTFGRFLDIEKPSFLSNLQFLFEYQIGYMYWRYFMWNFVGRQNDIAGDYSVLNGNWISGFSFLDEIRLGNQNQLDMDALNNKARNTYYFFPLIFGIIGLIYLYQKDPKKFWVLLLFFLFTGIALKIYLNERPFEPRERDYALVGSFYVFCIWIAMGVLSLIDRSFSNYKTKALGPIITLLGILLTPILMGYQNWDDHDRSNRYTAQSIAKSYLSSITKDVGAIIFTIGDNDTFALWYAQEIEGFRTDVRTINTSLLATDWYIDQTKRKTYKSNPVKSQLKHSLYAYGVRDYIKHESLSDSLRWDIKDFINWVASDDDRTKYKNLILQSGGNPNNYPKSTQEMVFYPTNKIRVSVDKENVIKSGIVKDEDIDEIVPYIDIDLPKSGITKNQLLMLDILANNNWKRPIYFTGGSFDASEYIWMKEYLQLDGLVYKLVPIKTPISKNNPYLLGRIDSDLMYNIVKQWTWGNSDHPSIYHDPETRKNSISFRSNLARLAEQLIKEGGDEKAKEVIDLALKKMPIDKYGYYSLLVPFIDSYYEIGEKELAKKLIFDISKKYSDRLNYFSSLKANLQYDLGEEIITEIERYRTLIEALLVNNDYLIFESQLDKFMTSIKPFVFLYGEYDFYTVLSDVVEGYYIIDKDTKAQELARKITDPYKKRLNVLANLPSEGKIRYAEQIKSEILNFRFFVEIIYTNDESDFAEKIKSEYEGLAEKFIE